MSFWLEFARTSPNRQHDIMGLSDADVVELVTAFRLHGYWRFDVGTGHFFATEDVSRIFGLEHREGPMNLVEIGARIHPEDLPLIMETYERASADRLTYHNIYRVKSSAEHYKYVRTVGKFRRKPGTAGEVVGITYEFFERRPGVTFFLDEEDD